MRCTNDAGEEVRLDAPVGEQLPAKGFDPGADTFVAPPPNSSDVEVKVDPASDRLQLLEAVPAVGRQGLRRAADPPQGPGQVHHRPHLDGRAVAEVPRPPREHLGQPVRRRRSTRSPARPAQARIRSTARREPFPEIAKHLHEAGVCWVAVGDENYGEGSSREHAAMEPRFRGAKVILVRSFARIHETNLKKQGVLPLTFADPAVYDLIEEDDKLSFLGLADLDP